TPANVKTIQSAPKFPPNWFPSREGTLVTHGHPGDQFVVILKPSGPSGKLQVDATLVLLGGTLAHPDPDTLYLELGTFSQSIFKRNGKELIVKKGDIPDVANLIPAHAKTPTEFDRCKAVLTPSSRPLPSDMPLKADSRK